MNISFILIGLAPLIIFALLDSFFSLKAGLIGAAIAVLIEAAMSLHYLGEIDKFTIYNALLVLAFSGLAWKFKSARYFKLQPSLVSLVFGAYLTGSYLMGSPILSEFLIKYQTQLTEALADQAQLAQQMQSPYFLKLMSEATFTFGILHFVHAGITAFAAIRFGNLIWILARTSIYVLMFIGIIWAQFRL